MNSRKVNPTKAGLKQEGKDLIYFQCGSQESLHVQTKINCIDLHCNQVINDSMQF